jgi:hypothetical protein
MTTQLYHDLVKNLLSNPCPSVKLSTPSYPNSSKYFDYPIQQYDIEVFPYQDHGKEVEEKTRDEGKTRRSREESPNQEDESDKPHHLEFIHPTSQHKPKNFIEAIFVKCLTLPNNLENPHQPLKFLA